MEITKETEGYLLDIVLLLQSCETKGDVVELLIEVQNMAVDKYKQKVKETIELCTHRNKDNKDVIIVAELLKELGLENNNKTRTRTIRKHAGR